MISRAVKIVGILIFSTQLFGNYWVNDTIGFIRGGLRNLSAVGTVFPLSRYMALAMIEKIEQSHTHLSKNNIKIVEMGAGNGALTEYFVTWIDQQMHDTGKKYSLDLIELDADFCQILRQKFKSYPWVSVYCADAATYQAESAYDIMVCTLPFNSHFFTANDVEKMLKNFESMLCNRGIFMYVEYAVCGSINKNLLLNREQKQNYIDKCILLANFKTRYKARSKIVFRNIPPTYLYSMHIVI